jgi:hypothetical protein
MTSDASLRRILAASAAILLLGSSHAATARSPDSAGRTAQPVDAFADERRRMVANVRQLITAGAMEGTANLDPAIAGAMAEVPRHLFVPEPLQSRAYSDQALPIGYDSTISQPLIVAAMTDLLRSAPATARSRSARAPAIRPPCSPASARACTRSRSSPNSPRAPPPA